MFLLFYRSYRSEDPKNFLIPEPLLNKSGLISGQRPLAIVINGRHGIELRPQHHEVEFDYKNKADFLLYFLHESDFFKCATVYFSFTRERDFPIVLLIKNNIVSSHHFLEHARGSGCLVVLQ
jgi:hypothetical protein